MSYSEFFQLLLGVPITILLTVLSFLIGAVLGFPLTLAQRSRFFIIRSVSFSIVMLIRALPPIVWLFIAFFAIGSNVIRMSPIESSIAVFGIISAAYMAEIYRGGFIAIHPGQWEACQVLNFSRMHTLTDVIIPQMFRVSLPSAATYAIALLKDSSIASTIGVAELTYRGTITAQFTFEGLRVFAIVGILYILMSIPIAWFARTTENRLREKIAH